MLSMILKFACFSLSFRLCRYAGLLVRFLEPSRLLFVPGPTCSSEGPVFEPF